MKTIVQRLLTFLIAALATFSVASHAALPSLSQTPLFLSASVKHNLMFVIDDSGSMDFQMELPTSDGTLTEHYHTCYDRYGNPYSCNSSITFAYVFYAPQHSANNGDHMYSYKTTPPIPKYAFTRYAADNKMYYDPSQTYTPWPSAPSRTYSNSDPTAAPRDPNYASNTVDLTSNWTDSFTYVSNDAQTTQTFTYFPAIYYVKSTDGSYTGVDSSGNSISNSCSTPKKSDFDLFEANPSKFSFTGDGVEALGMDGECLKLVSISDKSATYNGLAYSDAIQNFANWFTYYRKRHLAMRAAVAQSLEGVSGLRVGMLWINETGSSDKVTMYDISDKSVGGGLDTLLLNHYDHFNGIYGMGTPLRSALNFAGEQYERTDANAPITQACQKNFALMFTDGYAYAEDLGIGNVDGSAGTPYADKYDSTQGDIAYKYWDTNLRPDLPTGKVKVPPGCAESHPDPQLDCHTFLHMNTYTVGLGAVGTLFGKTYFKVADAYTNPILKTAPTSDPTATVWPDPKTDETPEQVDDLYHAAVNGHGEAYSVSSTKELIKGLGSAMRNIVSRLGSASAVTFNTATVKTNALIFSAQFNSSNWSGDLIANNLNSVNGQLTLVGGSYIGSVAWDAASLLDSSSVTASSRNIVTYDGSKGVPFSWGNLNSTEQSDLLAGGVTTTEAQQRLNFIRGDRSQEGVLFRKRASRMGDIVHSSPVYISTPAMGWPDQDPFGSSTDRYTDFKAAESSREPVIYVGANDGMLHAFDASTGASGGKELFDYIPESVYSSATGAGLHYLTEKDYNHHYYVDLSPSVGDVYLTDAGGTGAWHSLLVGGLRSGGKGIFAIDVTDPSKFNSESSVANLVQWEFTDANDNNLGYLTGPVQFAMVKDGSSYRWKLIFGNGYDPATGETGLFMLDLQDAVDGTWDAGDWQFIDLGPGDGLVSNVRLVDLNGDHVVDRIYATDYDGNLWALAPSSSGKWGSVYTKGSTPEPLFTAKDSSGSPQPIQSPPIVYRNQSVTSTSANDPNLMVAFGTGQYLTKDDLSNTQTQSFYSVWDRGTSLLTRSNLTKRTLSDTTVSGVDVRHVSGSAISWYDGTSGSYGWYMDFDTQTGERVDQSPSLRNTTLFFNTDIPSTSACQSGGSSVEMFLNLDGTEPDRNVFDTNHDGLINSSDVKAAGFFNTGGLLTRGRVLGDVMFQSSTGTVDGTASYVGGSKVDLGKSHSNVGRLGWHEITE